MPSIYKRKGRKNLVAEIKLSDGSSIERSMGTTDKTSARRLAQAIQDNEREKEIRGIDPAAESLAHEQTRPLADHLAEFVAYLTSKGTTAKTIDATENRAGRIIKHAKAERVSDLTPGGVLAALEALRTPGEELPEGLSNRTANHYLRAIKGFTRWLVRERRTTTDPLAGLSPLNAEIDRRRVRRELSEDEVNRIIAAAGASPSVQVSKTYRDGEKQLREMLVTLNAPHRAWAYRVAAATGLRSGELASLTRASFDLDSDTPTVTLEAGYSKHRRRDVQPLPETLAESLRGFFKGKPKDATLFALPDQKGALFLRADMETARAKWIDEATDAAERGRRNQSDFLRPVDAAGRVADFHSLRVTFISRVVATGATLKQAMELARHSDPKLTMRTYARVGLATLGGIVNALPVPGRKRGEHDAAYALKTGTHDAPVAVGKVVGAVVGERGAKPSRGGASGRDESDADAETDGERNVLKLAELRDEARSNAHTHSNAPGQVRTADLRFRKPLGTLQNTGAAEGGGGSGGGTDAKSASVGSMDSEQTGGEVDPDLAAVVGAWESLPPALRAGIVAMVKAAGR